MIKKLMIVFGIFCLCVLSYQLGKSKSEIKYISKKNEVIQNEKNCATRLLAQPNIDNDAVTRLFDSGLL